METPEEFDRRVERVEAALGGDGWRVILAEGEIHTVTTRQLLECLDRVHAHLQSEGPGYVPDAIHPLIPRLRTAVGVPPGEGTLPLYLISLLQVGA